jgi:hypothetical protein
MTSARACGSSSTASTAVGWTPHPDSGCGARLLRREAERVAAHHPAPVDAFDGRAEDAGPQQRVEFLGNPRHTRQPTAAAADGQPGTEAATISVTDATGKAADSALRRLALVFGLSSAELGGLFGVSPAVVERWRSVVCRPTSARGWTPCSRRLSRSA